MGRWRRHCAATRNAAQNPLKQGAEFVAHVSSAAAARPTERSLHARHAWYAETLTERVPQDVNLAVHFPYGYRLLVERRLGTCCRHIGLAAIGRPEPHRERAVEHDPADEHALGEFYTPDGFFQTACQQACPSDAIVFGDLNNAASRVATLSKTDRHYRMLEELGIKPSVTYLADISNPATEKGKA